MMVTGRVILSAISSCPMLNVSINFDFESFLLEVQIIVVFLVVLILNIS